MRKLQLGLIVLTAASVAFVVGCGDSGSTKRKGTIQGANKRAGTAGKAGAGNLDENLNLNKGGKTGEQKVGSKVEGKLREFPEAQEVLVSRLQTIQADLEGGTKAIKISDIPEGKYQLERVSHLVMLNSNLDGLFHSFDIVPPSGALENKVNFRTKKFMTTSGDGLWTTLAPVILEKSKDTAVKALSGVKYESRNEGKKLLLALTDSNPVFDLVEIEKSGANENGAYVTESTEDGQYRAFKVLSAAGKIIVLKETNSNSKSGSANKLRYEYFTYKLLNTDSKTVEKLEVKSSKDDGSKT